MSQVACLTIETHLNTHTSTQIKSCSTSVSRLHKKNKIPSFIYNKANKYIGHIYNLCIKWDLEVLWHFSQEIYPLCYFNKLSNTSLMGLNYSNHNECCKAVTNLTFAAKNCNSKRVLSLSKGAVRICYVKWILKRNSAVRWTRFSQRRCIAQFRQPTVIKHSSWTGNCGCRR